MALTLVGKILGLYRDRLLAVHYSVGMEANAFFTASRIPRVFFDAVFSSAIAACFIPVFSECLARKGKKEALRFAGGFLTIVTLAMAVLTGLGMLFPRPLVLLFADYQDPNTTDLAVSLTRVLFPTVLFSGIAFSLVGILQAQDHFTAPALMSIVSNAVIIAYFIWGDSSFGIFGLAAAYLAGWFLQGLIQIPPLKKLDSPLRPSLPVRSVEMKKVFVLMGPVMVSAWFQPLNLVINSRFGSRLYGGSGVAALEYATNLYLVIAGVFILSVTNVIFPRLSRLTAGGQQSAFQDTLRQTLHSTLFFILPMSAGLTAVAKPLVSFLYGGGEFDQTAVDLTATALSWMSLGMTGYAVQNILSRAYFARQDGRGPLIAGALAIGLNVALCAVLTGPFEVAGLAFSSAASSTAYALFLLVPMERQGGGVLNRALVSDLAKMLASALLTGVCARLALSGLAGFLPENKAGELISLGGCAGLGVMVYFLMTWAFGLSETKLVVSSLKDCVNRKRG